MPPQVGFFYPVYENHGKQGTMSTASKNPNALALICVLVQISKLTLNWPALADYKDAFSNA